MFYLTPTASQLIHERAVDQTFEFPLVRDVTKTVSVNVYGTMLLAEGATHTVAWIFFVEDLPLALSTLRTRSARARSRAKTVRALLTISKVLFAAGLILGFVGLLWWASFFAFEVGVWGTLISVGGIAIGLLGFAVFLVSSVLERRSSWSPELRDSGVLGEVTRGSDGVAEAGFTYCLPVHRDRIAKAFREDSEKVALEVLKRFGLSWRAKWQVDMTEAINRAEALDSAAETLHLDELNRSVGRYLEGVNLDNETPVRGTRRIGGRFGRNS